MPVRPARQKCRRASHDEKGQWMKAIGGSCRAAAVAFALLQAPAWAAAPVDVGVPETPLAALGIERDGEFALEKEMVVHNWVLCISQPLAEELVRAREAGMDPARKAYEGLAGSRSCGVFPELRVILRERLYAARAEGYDVRAFGALVNLAGDWASAYVVSGGLPAE